MSHEMRTRPLAFRPTATMSRLALDVLPRSAGHCRDEADPHRACRRRDSRGRPHPRRRAVGLPSESAVVGIGATCAPSSSSGSSRRDRDPARRTSTSARGMLISRRFNRKEERGSRRGTSHGSRCPPCRWRSHSQRHGREVPPAPSCPATHEPSWDFRELVV